MALIFIIISIVLSFQIINLSTVFIVIPYVLDDKVYYVFTYYLIFVTHVSIL